MRIISNQEIKELNISNETILNWTKQVFIEKPDYSLPKKISQPFDNGDGFYNTMPAINKSIDTYGVKIVNRYPGRIPSIKGNCLIYSYTSGDLLALLDAEWITSKRTGAVAALTVDKFAKDNFESIAITGFGSAGMSFLEMITCMKKFNNKLFKIREYKGRAQKISKYLKKQGVNNVQICYTNEEFIRNSDVIVSSITVANNLLGKDEWYKEGVLVVPIHTRGFQNCDLFFDKVFVDDTNHVSNFKNFANFKKVDEFSNVITNKADERSSNKERILAYNIGIALHDIYLSRKIYNIIIINLKN